MTGIRLSPAAVWNWGKTGMNRLHVYTGDGKGKTTAAMGLAVRSLGHGNRVLIGQFLKDGRSGELRALAMLPGALVCPCAPLQGFVSQQSETRKAETAERMAAYMRELVERIARHRPQTVVLDELGVALCLGMAVREDADRLIDAALASGETVVTGRMVPEWLLERADYISRIEAQRHPYDTEGLPAREGVEW